MKKLLKIAIQKILILLRGTGLIAKEDSPQKMRHSELLEYFKSTPQNKNIQILDVGCGTGDFLRGLKNEGFYQLHGCDWIQQNFPDFEYKRVDLNLESLKIYADQSFDVIFCSDVIEHMENPALLLREIHRIMKPAGLAYISIPNAWNLLERLAFLFSANSSRYRSERKSGPFGHISFFTPHILESLLDRASLKMVSDEAGSGYLWGHKLNFVRSPLAGYNYMMCLARK